MESESRERLCAGCLRVAGENEGRTCAACGGHLCPCDACGDRLWYLRRGVRSRTKLGTPHDVISWTPEGGAVFARAGAA